MWALLLKYIVMMQAGPEKAIQPSIQQGVVRFWVNKCYLKKAESQNGKKKKKKESKERRSNQSPMELHRTEKCLALAT